MLFQSSLHISFDITKDDQKRTPKNGFLLHQEIRFFIAFITDSITQLSSVSKSGAIAFLIDKVITKATIHKPNANQ